MDSEQQYFPTAHPTGNPKSNDISSQSDPRYPPRSRTLPPDSPDYVYNNNVRSTPSQRIEAREPLYVGSQESRGGNTVTTENSRGASHGSHRAYEESYRRKDRVAPSSRSFAARVGAIPSDIDPALTDFATERVVGAQTSKDPRRNSLNQPRRSSAGQNGEAPFSGPPSEALRTAEKPYGPTTLQSRKDPSETSRRSLQPRPLAIDTSQNIHNDTSPLVRSSTTRSSRTSQADWAADRSPLQRLEVKLNDISKEEKRARVQEAEQKLRDRNATSDNHRASQPLPNVTRNTSKRVSSGPPIDPNTAKSLPSATGGSRNGDRNVAITRRADSRRGRGSQTDPVGGKSSNQMAVPISSRSEQKSSKSIQSKPDSPPLRTSSNRRKSADLARPDDREVRFQKDVQHINGEAPRNGLKVNTNGHAKTSPRTREAVDDGIRDLGANHLQREPVGKDEFASEAPRSHHQALKYEVPPQTEAGIKTRQQIGFGSRLDGSSEPPSRKQHRLPELWHRDKYARPSEAQAPIGASKHIEEWRAGEKAHLTLADVQNDGKTPRAEKATPWWESPQSSGKRRKSRSEDYDEDAVLHDNSREPSKGEDISLQKFLAASAISRDEQIKTRRYAEKTTPQGARLLSNLPISRMGSRLTRRRPSDLALYSYSCPHLSEHSPLHHDHICQPYMSRELIRSMRSIRVRDPIAPEKFEPALFLKCGPLLRYTGMRRDKVDGPDGKTLDLETWRGSVMVVTADASSNYNPPPMLRLFHQPMKPLPPPPQVGGEDGVELDSDYVDPIAGLPKLSRTGGTVYVKPVEDLEEGKDVSRLEDDDGIYEETRTANVSSSYGLADDTAVRSAPAKRSSRNRRRSINGRYREVQGIRLHAERGITFWRFNLEVELVDEEIRVAYSINRGSSVGFWVPAKGQTMNIMFHSCNGFSMSVNPDTFSGPDPLWRDVLNSHQTKPFHVMIGGGDQIYNDAVMSQTRHFSEWLEIKNPHHKHQAEFSAEMLEELETFYLERYSMWFSQGLFGMANSQIPMVNLWDDHDIIDGYGSYPHHFMASPVFCGLGNVAFKYYMLFQHQSVVDELASDEPSWLLGASPGPYINELSRSVFMFLGKHVAFLGLDCRTERMRDEILSEASYDLVLDRCHREIVKGETKHLIVLLGVPIAYPRLVWLENILTSRALDPLKALGRMGVLGNFMNKFDGGVEILDDLDDHWTAKNHKEERNWFIEELQELAAEKSIRVTILSGDVHLAAIGQFYSPKRLNLRKDQDFRYMPNIISSAIVNTPPPDMMADVLNKRNKTHNLNAETEENMIPIFTHDVDGKTRNNKRLLPRRNWCAITEYVPGSTPPPTPPSLTPSVSEESLENPGPTKLPRTLSLTRGDSKPAKLIRRLSLSQRTPSSDYAPSPYGQDLADSKGSPSQPQVGNRSAPATPAEPPIPVRPVGQFHRRPTDLPEKAAAKGGADSHYVDLEYGLDVKLNCEIKQGDPSGSTESYRLLVPALFYDGELPEHQPRRKSLMQRIGSRKVNKAAANQGQGNWGQRDSESELGSETKPSQRHRFSFSLGRSASTSHEPRSATPMRPMFQARPQASPARPVQTTAGEHVPGDGTGPREVAYQKRSPFVQERPSPRPVSHNATAALEPDESAGDLEEEAEEAHVPRKKVGGKFDASGASKFFGADVGGAGGNAGRARPAADLGGGNGKQGYSGIEAYQEPKGWRRRFF